MKKLIAICICLLVLCGLVGGCKTQKKVVQESSTSERTDTTKITIDSVHEVTTKQESRTNMVFYNDWGYIEFADSIGTLTINGDLISAKGVKSYHQGKQASLTNAESITQSKDSTTTHKQQENAIYNQNKKQTEQPQKQGVKALKWYQRTIYHIGFLCCLAAIIYAIFLYLRRKK